MDYSACKIGDQLFGDKISKIHSASESYIVYESESDPGRVMVVNDSNINSKKQLFAGLLAEARNLLISKSEKNHFSGPIARGCAVGLGVDPNEAKKILKRTIKAILEYKQAKARINYLIYCLGIVLVILLFLACGEVFLPKSISGNIASLFFLCKLAGLGSMGGFLSIAINLRKLDLNIYVRPFLQVITLAIVRISLAMFSSIIAYLLIRSGLILHFLYKPDNIFILYSIAVTAGFSEQFIPNIIRQTENNVRTANEQKTAE